MVPMSITDINWPQWELRVVRDVQTPICFQPPLTPGGVAAHVTDSTRRPKFSIQTIQARFSSSILYSLSYVTNRETIEDGAPGVGTEMTDKTCAGMRMARMP